MEPTNSSLENNQIIVLRHEAHENGNVVLTSEEAINIYENFKALKIKNEKLLATLVSHYLFFNSKKSCKLAFFLFGS